MRNEKRKTKNEQPSTLALAAFVLMATALAASYVPVRRVLAQNPLASLRND